jgi:uncharacterized membrane protein YgcG
MKKIVAMLVAIMATLFTVNALAFTPPPSPAPASWISDTSGVLSADAHARLDAKLRQINQGTANEIAALVVQSLDGEDIATVGDVTAKTWGVGKKGLDNGVLVVLAVKDRKSRISTGKGVEGDLPDLKANDILVAARPYLRKGDYEGALGFIFDKSASTIANHKADLAAGKTGSGNRQSCDVSGGVGSSSGGAWILVLVAGSAIALVWYLSAQAKRRRLAEERERLERQAARRRQAEEREADRKRDEERRRKAALNKATPVVAVPSVPRPTVTPSVPRPSAKPAAPSVRPPAPVVPVVAAVSAAASLAAADEEARRQRADADRRRREQEDESRRARERADEDRRRRERDEEDRRRQDSYSSSYSSSSSSSWDSGGSSGSFGGGDSGGGGSSGDW